MRVAIDDIDIVVSDAECRMISLNVETPGIVLEEIGNPDFDFTPPRFPIVRLGLTGDAIFFGCFFLLTIAYNVWWWS